MQQSLPVTFTMSPKVAIVDVTKKLGQLKRLLNQCAEIATNTANTEVSDNIICLVGEIDSLQTDVTNYIDELENKILRLEEDKRRSNIEWGDVAEDHSCTDNEDELPKVTFNDRPAPQKTQEAFRKEFGKHDTRLGRHQYPKRGENKGHRGQKGRNYQHQQHYNKKHQENNNVGSALKVNIFTVTGPYEAQLPDGTKVKSDNEKGRLDRVTAKKKIHGLSNDNAGVAADILKEVNPFRMQTGLGGGTKFEALPTSHLEPPRYAKANLNNMKKWCEQMGYNWEDFAHHVKDSPPLIGN
jgi:hypothetical protein